MEVSTNEKIGRNLGLMMMMMMMMAMILLIFSYWRRDVEGMGIAGAIKGIVGWVSEMDSDAIHVQVRFLKDWLEREYSIDLGSEG